MSGCIYIYIYIYMSCSKGDLSNMGYVSRKLMSMGFDLEPTP